MQARLAGTLRGLRRQAEAELAGLQSRDAAGQDGKQPRGDDPRSGPLQSLLHYREGLGMFVLMCPSAICALGAGK